MTAPLVATAAPSTQALLTERLMGAVRLEFRADVLVFAATDPIFGGGACRVDGCPRSARGKGMCPGHHLRWVKHGRPDVDMFAASTDPRWRRQLPNTACRVEGCGYGVARAGMCQPHYQRWERAARPELPAWLLDPPPVKQPEPGAACRVGHCTLWPHAGMPFCHAHAATWRANSRPDIAEFIERFTVADCTEDETIRLGRLPAQLKLELQYALQCRNDERAAKTMPAVVMAVVRFLTDQDVTSLLERDERTWRTQIGRPAPHDCNSRALLAYARRKVEDLADAGGGWDGEYPLDRWQLRRLGFAGNQSMSFDGITAPWLRDLVKRWLRWRLSTGLNLETVRRGLRCLTRFARFCDRHGVAGLVGVDRNLLERYLADLHSEFAGRPCHGSHIGQLASFLHAVRQHRWDDSLPATALIFTDDYPHRAERPPRALAEHIMAQVEHPENLDRWDNPAHRLVTVILIRCGLRVTDALRLPYDPLVADADGAPYLRYYNHKMKREALVPIDEQLHAMILEQQVRLADHQAPPPPVLFPRPTKNTDRAAPIASSTYRPALARWLQRCDVRDERGAPVHLTPHQWRHTLGTRLINRDVPQEVVRRLLDHDSPQMTAHYARLHDTTVRRHWEAARKVDVDGQVVDLDPDGPLAEAAWAKQRLGRVTQALPNGFCGLPVQQTCPHANACLTCPMFITTNEFLPQHHAHREQVVRIITKAEAHGQSRLVEMNQQVLTNLERIITTLEEDPMTGTETADAS